MVKPDINSDLGEGFGNDEHIMPLIGSCNIACGGHYGDRTSMFNAVEMALKYSVNAGAHPSYPDKENFGRKIIRIERTELIDSICLQIEAFKDICSELEKPMHHVKLHGALYNQAAVDEQIATLVLEAFNQVCPAITIYAPYQSTLAYLAQDEFTVIHEAFADRSYHNNLQLVSRNHEKALISNPIEAWQQIQSIMTLGKVTTVEGVAVNIQAQTFCVHGDQAYAVELLKYINNKINSM